MTEQDIFDQTKDAYLALVHPVCRDDLYRQDIAPVVELGPSVPDDLIASMITGPSWRARLLGICLAMAKRPGTFIEPLVRSLQDPRGIAIVPTCAALAVLARHGSFAMPHNFPARFDLQAFDGEIGWAIGKALHFAGLRAHGECGRGPNYGQIFEDHIQVYSWIRPA